MKEGLLDIVTEEYECSKEEKILLNEFNKYGYSRNTLISKSELSLFLDMKSPNKKFDKNLSEKLFNFLDLDDLATISVIQFVTRFILYYENYIKNKDESAEEIFKNIINSKDDKSKINIEICDIKFNVDSKEIKELIIKILYNREEKDIINNIIEKNENNYKLLEFNFTSPDDNMKFILFSKDTSGNIKEIGTSIYSLKSIINSTQSILTQIEIPFNENQETIAALITMNMSILKSGIKNNGKKSKKEPKNKNLKQDEGQICPDNKKGKNNIKGLSKKTFEFPKDKYIIKFNNERTYDKKEKKLCLYFNNEKTQIKIEEVKKENINEKKIKNDFIKTNNKKTNNNIEINNINYNGQNDILNFDNQ
jgi:hypothetical protein